MNPERVMPERAAFASMLSRTDLAMLREILIGVRSTLGAGMS